MCKGMITSKWIFGQDDISIPLKIRNEVFGDELGIRDFGAEDELDAFS